MTASPINMIHLEVDLYGIHYVEEVVGILPQMALQYNPDLLKKMLSLDSETPSFPTKSLENVPATTGVVYLKALLLKEYSKQRNLSSLFPSKLATTYLRGRGEGSEMVNSKRVLVGVFDLGIQGTTFEARVWDYMAAHTEKMERFENSISKQREEINDRMAKMFGLLKELTTSRAPKKVLIREEAKPPITKNHRINEKLIEGLVDNHRFNDSLSGIRVGKMKGKTYNLLPKGPVYKAILKKKITRKEDIRGNFEIPCNIGGLKRINALVDQVSNINIMPLSTYMKLTDERPVETDIRLSLASHSYIYPLVIVEDVLVNFAGYVYLVDFMILDIREDKKRPFILRTPFMTTAKAVIKFDKGTITLRSGNSKISFHRIPESLGKVEKGIKNDIEPIAPTMTSNRLVLE
ncbi:MAK10-like protein [Tanacetum coccineum]